MTTDKIEREQDCVLVGETRLDVDTAGFSVLESVEAELERRRQLGSAFSLQSAGSEDALFDKD